MLRSCARCARAAPVHAQQADDVLLFYDMLRAYVYDMANQLRVVIKNVMYATFKH